ncbi:maltodextrin glucosidase [Salinispirillum marinum]|uniref:Maltodextrin glucosidase n=2 Tax=Saccharospirillaceae TaxID=255527 RepID=A0ABV8BCC7_9GAMM
MSINTSRNNGLFHLPIPGFLHQADGQLQVQLRVEKTLNVQQVWVRIQPDNEELLVPMLATDTTDAWQNYEASFALDGVQAHTAYVFKVQGDQQMLWLAADGMHPRIPPLEVHFKQAHEAPPAWVSEQIFYQIFPDRFRNGDPTLNVADGAYHYLNKQPVKARTWAELPAQAHGPSEFFNGDLTGVVQALDYVQHTLGATAIYLNPVFRSDSNHKYDTVDYFAIDPHLGGDDALLALRHETQQRGMRMLLDGVLNHTSVKHPWFVQAQQGIQPYADYFMAADGDYVSWKGHKSLPVLDYSNPDVVEVFYQGERSVLRHWLRPPFAMDGWRLDVIHMLGEGAGAANNAAHVKAMRRVIKEENPEAYFLGEHFFEATSWLQGDQEDGAMNYYGFLQPVWMFLAGVDIARQPAHIDAADLAAWMREARAKIPFALAKTQFNLLDSHDTPRFFTLLQENQPRMQMAVRLLMVYLGVPCIYYGDEVGLTGGEDPACRAPFPWDHQTWHETLLRTYQTAINWRKELPELRDGAVVDLYAEGDMWVFARALEHRSVLVAVNRGITDARLTVPVQLLNNHPDQAWCSLDSGQIVKANEDGCLQLPVAAQTTELWVSSAPSSMGR